MNDSVWILSSPTHEAEALASGLSLPVELAHILINRGIRQVEEAHSFLYGSLQNLHDPYLMDGMKEAVDRIRRAVSSGETIMIFGDFDVDGILSVVMLTKALQILGAKVDYYVPERLKDGYGLKEKHIDIVLEKKATLVISVDCGIKATEFASRAAEKGIDFIVTDHHLPGLSRPKAVAILDPSMKECRYPDRDLAGVGVVFKLIQALMEANGRSETLPHYLKLVSIGTIADVATLRGENRLMVKFGLRGLENVTNKGLKSLMNICGLKGKKISVGDVGFRIGPRINAAGRLGMTDSAIQLFFSDEVENCRSLVQVLDKLNKKRQLIEDKIYREASRFIQENALDSRYRLLVLGCERWHRGVIGIVASKLKDYFYRPVILFTYDNGRAIGSGRSIKDFSLIDCLDANRHCLESYGGHKLAVGCELPHSGLSELKASINRYAMTYLPLKDLRRKVFIDSKISLSSVSSVFIDKLSLLAPFGVGNPKPKFLSQNVEVAGIPRKLKGRHSKILVKQGGAVFEALGWGRPDWADSLQAGERLDLVFSLEKNEYQGEERTHLVIEDLDRSPAAEKIIPG